jgi:hypothetical protein
MLDRLKRDTRCLALPSLLRLLPALLFYRLKFERAHVVRDCVFVGHSSNFDLDLYFTRRVDSELQVARFGCDLF